MKKLLTTAAFTTLFAASAPAFTILLDAESLKDAVEAEMRVGGLVVLTAATLGGFSGPNATSFTSGNEIVLAKWDLSAFGMEGLISEATGDLAFTGNWGPGDPLRLYWYPTLNLTSSAPGGGTAFGTYRDPAPLGSTGLDGSAAWFTGAASDTISLKFFTSDANFLSLGGANLVSAGVASGTVIPEPTTAMLLLSGSIALGFARRRGVPRADGHGRGH